MAALPLPIGYAAVYYPETLLGTALTVFWGAIFVWIFRRVVWSRLGDRWLTSVVGTGLLIRIPIVLAHLTVGFLIFRLSLDFPVYFAHGVRLAEALLAGNLGEFFDMEFTLTLGTAIVWRLLALTYFLVGPSLEGMFLFSGLIGFLGGYLFLRAFQAEFPLYREARFLALSLFFFPSLAFWTSLLGKESWMFFFLGLTTYALVHTLKAWRLRHVLALILSVVFATLIRPPIGIALAGAAAGALLLGLHSRLPRQGHAAILRPAGHILFGTVILVAAMAGITYFRSSAGRELLPVGEGFLELAARKHADLVQESARRGVLMPVVLTDDTIGGFLRFLPRGMFGFLFRPFLFEAHNFLAVIAAVDATLLGLLVLWRWKHLLAAIRAAFSRPFVVFCWTVVLMFTAILSFEANFGVMVRHRSMVLAFLFILLAIPRPRRSILSPSGASSAIGANV